ncbi:hypothetical protein [Halalkalibacter krulwichiae]|uniref:hypothetical protein n=1 Tax=Halalkalibacter krulwichiae TaxID=199441 RepID=UPI002147ABEB|nr:hypothetical protein [Halalkalibacter krulwichiae]
MEEQLEEKVTIDPSLWEPIAPSALPPKQVTEIANDLRNSKNPLIVTSYLGRNEAAVNELIRLSEQLAIPVLESCPNYVNFPADHAMHIGYQWNTPEQNKWLEQADVILVLDSDVPWIPLKNKPGNEATIYYIDADPIKEQMPLWYIPSKNFFKADSQIALEQLNEKLSAISDLDQEQISNRWEKFEVIHHERKQAFRLMEEPDGDAITPEYLTACVREIIDQNTIVVNEGISNYPTISNHLELNRSGMLFGSGAGSLGWNGGAAIGMKLADPTKTVISLTGMAPTYSASHHRFTGWPNVTKHLS